MKEILDFLLEVMKFMKEKKKFILLPVIIIIFLFVLINLIGSSSAVAPFIYTLF